MSGGELYRASQPTTTEANVTHPASALIHRHDITENETNVPSFSTLDLYSQESSPSKLGSPLLAWTLFLIPAVFFGWMIGKSLQRSKSQQKPATEIPDASAVVDDVPQDAGVKSSKILYQTH